MNDRFAKIENEPGYVKDLATSAILNTDLAALAEYRQKKKQSRQIREMQEEINMLKTELEQIKTHLKIS